MSNFRAPLGSAESVTVDAAPAGAVDAAGAAAVVAAVVVLADELEFAAARGEPEHAGGRQRRGRETGGLNPHGVLLQLGVALDDAVRTAILPVRPDHSRRGGFPSPCRDRASQP